MRAAKGFREAFGRPFDVGPNHPPGTYSYGRKYTAPEGDFFKKIFFSQTSATSFWDILVALGGSLDAALDPHKRRNVLRHLLAPAATNLDAVYFRPRLNNAAPPHLPKGVLAVVAVGAKGRGAKGRGSQRAQEPKGAGA
jgi:hypothetical protein